MTDTGMSEGAIQKVIANKLRKAGFLVTTMPAPSGWPDIRAWGKNRTLAIEVKRKGKLPSELQDVFLKEFKEAGVEVYIMDDTSSINDVIKLTEADILYARLKEL